jgi:hypothetical protein
MGINYILPPHAFKVFTYFSADKKECSKEFIVEGFRSPPE